ncbi:hypothetical protein M6B38_305690 [Iris pallida]|uniref:Uncharacterized protein n=1 Tax=Iris pallida TaxID=29817 RepID=A0AAX6G2Z3_IRIPA|nr:hypothetical protein M6B38_387440 [Iris pallida]KAJ6841663.1 hypothetical protein M6B38_305690 [Iris pallida]
MHLYICISSICIFVIWFFRSFLETGD